MSRLLCDVSDHKVEGKKYTDPNDRFISFFVCMTDTPRTLHQDKVFAIINHLGTKDVHVVSSFVVQRMVAKVYKDLSSAYICTAMQRYEDKYYPTVLYITPHSREYVWDEMPCPKNKLIDRIKFTLMDIFFLWR